MQNKLDYATSKELVRELEKKIKCSNKLQKEERAKGNSDLFYYHQTNGLLEAIKLIEANTNYPTKFNYLKELASSKGINIYGFLKLVDNKKVKTKKDLEAYCNRFPKMEALDYLQLLKYLKIKNSQLESIYKDLERCKAK